MSAQGVEQTVARSSEWLAPAIMPYIDIYRCEDATLISNYLDASEEKHDPNGTEDIIERVRERYASAAITVLETGGRASCCDAGCGTAEAGDAEGACCGTTVVEVDETFGGALYTRAEQDEVPVAAVAASLGCGNPTAVAQLREGERGPRPRIGRWD